MSQERVRPDEVLPASRQRRRPSARRTSLVSPFRRLARTHALMATADAAMAGALAGSLFLSISPDAARGKVLLYQLISVAPFAVVAPLIGPTIDRVPGGRRIVMQLTAFVRALLYLVIIFHINDVFLFPLVFGVMVMQKTYAVSKSAIVPSVVRDENELVEANSKLSLISGVLGGLVVGPFAGLGKVATALALIPGALLFLAAAVAARRLPHEAIAPAPPKRREREELHSISIITGVGAIALLRASVGFLTFHLLFWMRSEYGLVWLGVAMSCSAIGSVVGNAIAPMFRKLVREEIMLTCALSFVATAGVVATLIGGAPGALVLAFMVNLSASVGRMAFDSIVQRDAPSANTGRAFAKFETRFQLSWVLAGVPPVLFTMPGRLGFLIVALIGSFATFTYLVAARATRAGKPLPPTITARARQGISHTAAKRRERRDGTPSARTTRPLPPPDASDRKR